MPATWDESRWAVLGAYLIEDGWSLKEAEKSVGCDDRAIKQANRVRRSADRDDRQVWHLLAAGKVRVSDAETLVRNVQKRYSQQPLLQRRAFGEAVRQFEAGTIKHLRHYSV